MTREQKLALVLGFALTLAATVLISDHFSAARDDVGEIGVSPELLQPETPHERVVFEAPVRKDDPPATRTINMGRPISLASGEESASPGDGLPNTIERLLGRRNGHVLEETVEPADVTPPAVPDDAIDSIRRHQVAPKETLWSIADRYYSDGNLANALADYNIKRKYLKDRNLIRVGATLLIPSRHELTGGAPDPERTAPAKPSFRTYTIRKNDTAWSIAERFLGDGRRWNEIVELNRDRVPNANAMPVGTEIRIPSS